MAVAVPDWIAITVFEQNAALESLRFWWPFLISCMIFFGIGFGLNGHTLYPGR